MAAQEDHGLGPADIAGIAAAASAAVGVVASLAVTGVLAEAQRNHGGGLITAFVLVLVAAGLWVVGALVAAPLKGWRSTNRTATFVKSNGGAVLRILAVFVFCGGLLLAIIAIVRTQEDSERPAVSATFDASTRMLTAKVSGHGLSSNHRLTVRVRGMHEQKRDGRYQLSPEPRYL